MEGLAYSLWLPDRRPARAGVVILHGAGSCKESHHDYARVVLGAGLAAIVFDQRGHGDSDGPMDDRVFDDIAAMAQLLRERSATRSCRSRSGGRAWAATSRSPPPRSRGAAAVVAICPASAAGLRRGLANGRFEFEADVPALDALSRRARRDAARSRPLDVPVLLLHAEGDEVVPVQHLA